MKLIRVQDTAQVWSFNRRLTHRLMAWAIPSMVLGLLHQLNRNEFLRALGLQSAVWGGVDAIIAQVGQVSAERKQMAATATTEIAHATTLRRLLWLNAALDVLYVVVGVLLLRRSKRAAQRGHGMAVIVQGGFLFLFDMIHALRTPRLADSDGQE